MEPGPRTVLLPVARRYQVMRWGSPEEFNTTYSHYNSAYVC